MSLYLSYVFTKAFSDEKSKRFKLLTHDSYHRLIMAHDLQTHYRFPPPLPSKRYTVNSLLTDTVIRRTPLLDRHLVLVPVVFQSFYCNSSTTLSDGQQTLLKLSADSWEELNAVKTPSKPKCRYST